MGSRSKREEEGTRGETIRKKKEIDNQESNKERGQEKEKKRE